MPKKSIKALVFALRLDALQRAQLQHEADQAGLKLAGYIRSRVLQSKPTVHEPSVALRYLLALSERIGHALNNTAHTVNSAFRRGLLNERQFKQWFNRLLSIGDLVSVAHTQLLTEGQPTIRRPQSEPLSSKDRASTYPVSFRLTASEYEAFAPLISQAAVTPSVFFRTLLLDDVPLFCSDLPLKRRVRFLANKAGNNLTQLALRANVAYRRRLIPHNLYERWLGLLIVIGDFMSRGACYADALQWL